MNHTTTIYRTLLVASILLPGVLQARDSTWQPAGIAAIIERVNDHWQATHPRPGNAFWHEAAYHTGNMAAYRATGREEYRRYSERWAEANEWKGAKSNRKQEWKFTYGETDEHVLFGDWQICFQTYIDLHALAPDKKKIARAREVMEHQMATAESGYWWWADGLYMVMPVMTKLYKATGNALYLQKLHEYFTFARRLMYDEENALFFRDARYVYPRHATRSGARDFWARGNGWVFAGLAKVLQDLPAGDPRRGEFLDIYRAMAGTLANTQQPAGHWTRSILDPAQAPGHETSGTAFFAYGLLHGINNGLLDRERYAPVAERAWEYLSRVALQPDGTVGYVQPIGERADQHANVGPGTTADFGVGAFLLAAAEMMTYVDDRAYWVNLAYRIAAPVLEPMSRGELASTMQVELSPTWDGRDRRVTYMEAFGRLMDGIAPWLALPDDDTPEGQQRRQLHAWALKSYAHAVDPASPDYLLWRKEGQPLVDAAFLASSFLRAPASLWQPLDETTKQRYIEEFRQLRRVDPPYTNWLLFSATVETFLLSVDARPDIYRVHSALRKIEEWYVGDGWYSDGEHFAFDYYNSYVIQPMYVQVLEVLRDRHRDKGLSRGLETARRRMQRHAMILERFISPEGAFPVFGRSMTYRLGVFQPLALLAWREALPPELPAGQVRNALTRVMQRMFSVDGNFNAAGFLQLGFAGHQPDIADRYTNNGSLYLTAEVFLPLGLPATHPFWSSPPLEWTQQKAWGGKPFPRDHAY
jgi:rhamnogalacturonyl hydrolase YesR